jgi:hypothetical protein
MRVSFSAITLASLLALVHAGTLRGQDSEKPSDLEKMAKQVVSHLEKGEFEEAIKNFDDVMRQALPADKLSDTWKKVMAQVGAFKKQIGSRTQKIGEYDAVLVTCEFEKQTLDVRLVFNAKKQIAGLQFGPSK